jgi:hypothetical protein
MVRYKSRTNVRACGVHVPHHAHRALDVAAVRRRRAVGINHKLSWSSIAFLVLLGALFIYWSVPRLLPL